MNNRVKNKETFKNHHQQQEYILAAPLAFQLRHIVTEFRDYNQSPKSGPVICLQKLNKKHQSHSAKKEKEIYGDKEWGSLSEIQV